MKTNLITRVAGSLFAVSLALTGCERRGQKKVEPAHESSSSAQSNVQNIDSDGSDGEEQVEEGALARFDEAKIYCMGMLLYAQKNQNLSPTNLNLILPYLKEVGRMPSGTNRFEILYQGSFLELTNSASIVIRSESWRGKNRNWTRIYGFADGHCEVRSEPDGNFDAWEKRHLPPASKSGVPR
jgi:hypothetical protein